MKGAYAWFCVLACGCGSNAPDVPPEWLVTDTACTTCGVDYPEGPYGYATGDVVPDLSFLGYRDPSANATSLETLSFSDFYDPDGERGVELLLVNAAAIWCAACHDEHEVLPDFYLQRRAAGLEIFGLLFQDGSGNPAQLGHLDLWVDAFGTNFAMGLDPELQLGSFASLETAPLNLVIDARTMTLLSIIIGNQQAALEAIIDGELESRGGS